MRAVMLEAPDELLEERRRRGADRWDELWEGVLHMVPPPSDRHQRVGTELLLALAPVAKEQGLVISYETGVFRNDTDYRVPDLVLTAPDRRSDRGVEAAPAIVVEIRSRDDETYEKLPFYEVIGTEEMIVVDLEAQNVELYKHQGGQLRVAVADPDGFVRSSVLDLSIGFGQDGQIRLRTHEGETLVTTG